MCGILFCRSQEAYTPTPEALEALIRRGPDELQTQAWQHPVSQEHIHFSSSRLKLVNLNPGVLLTYKTWTMAYNGEIYQPEQYLPADQVAESDGMVLLRGLVDVFHMFPDHQFFYERVQHLFTVIRGSFAFVMYDRETETVMFGRDFYGIRPLIVAQHFHVSLQLASLFRMIKPFPEMTWMEVPPGSLWVQERGSVPFPALQLPTLAGKIPSPLFEEAVSPTLEELGKRYLRGVELRLLHNAQRPVAIECSGGLDSSKLLVLACKLLRDLGRVPNIELHVITMGDCNSPDMLAAERLVEYCGLQNTHHRVPFPEDRDLLLLLREVILATETVDITTIRASIPQFLLCKYVSEHTPAKIILCGEGADELGQGYQFYRRAPTAKDGDRECRKALRQNHKFDITRKERCASYWGLEARFPDYDTWYASYYLRFPAEMRWARNDSGLEKFLMREMMRVNWPELLPESIRLRPKEAFSDAAFPSLIARLKHLSSKGGIFLPPLPRAIQNFMRLNPSYQFNSEMKLYWSIFRCLFPHVPWNLAWPFGNWRVNVDWFDVSLRDKLYVEPSARLLPCYEPSEFTTARQAMLQPNE